MSKYIELGKLDKKYVFAILIAIATFFITKKSFAFFKEDKKKYIPDYVENNKLLKSLCKYFGFSISILYNR